MGPNEPDAVRLPEGDAPTTVVPELPGWDGTAVFAPDIPFDWPETPELARESGPGTAPPNTEP